MLINFDCDSAFIMVQCSLFAGRLTSGPRTITVIVSGGVVVQAIAFLLLLLKNRSAPICGSLILSSMISFDYLYSSLLPFTCIYINILWNIFVFFL